jgi:hypothetical protein
VVLVVEENSSYSQALAVTDLCVDGNEEERL